MNRCGWYIDSPERKATINLINKKDSKCFQYALTVALNHEEIEKDPQRITKIKSFINKYNWEGITFPSAKDDWKKIEKKNVTFALNILNVKKGEIYPGYVPNEVTEMKGNSFNDLKGRKTQSYAQRTMKSSSSERTIRTIERNSLQTLWWFLISELRYSFVTEEKTRSHKKIYETKDFCNAFMPSEDTKILEFNQYKKSEKALFIAYASLEYIIEKINACRNNPENSPTTKWSEHVPSGFSVSTISTYKLSIMYILR